jgi:hypothetical protein
MLIAQERGIREWLFVSETRIGPPQPIAEEVKSDTARARSNRRRVTIDATLAAPLPRTFSVGCSSTMSTFQSGRIRESLHCVGEDLFRGVPENKDV